MLPTQRRRAILAELRQTQAVSAEDLAQRFGVSAETIRRDLRGLRDRGLLERVYGGALPVRSTEDTRRRDRARGGALARLGAGDVHSAAEAVGPAEVESRVAPAITADEAAERLVAFRSALPLALAGR